MPNPHIVRLKRQPGCLSAQRTWCACLVVMGGGGLLALLPTVALPIWGITMGFLLMVFVAPVALLLPAIFGAMTAANTAADVNSGDYELIMLTPMRNRELAWGYFYVGLWRVRTLLTTLAGSLLVTTLLLALGFVLYPERDVNDFELIRLLVGVAALGVQLIGLSLLAISLGVALAVWTRSAFGLSVMMPIVMLVLVGGFQYGTCFLTGTFHQMSTAFVMMLVIASSAPYGLAALSLWAANAGVRRSRT